jgi:hypothetical protein
MFPMTVLPGGMDDLSKISHTPLVSIALKSIFIESYNPFWILCFNTSLSFFGVSLESSKPAIELKAAFTIAYYLSLSGKT